MLHECERHRLKGDKLGVNLIIDTSSPEPKSLHLRVECDFFGKYDPMFLRLSKDVVKRDLINVVYDTVVVFCDSFLTSESPDQEVSDNE